MAWIEPKTNWKESDYFNAADYNRIVGNITYLKALAEKLFPLYSIEDMGGTKTYSSMIYAREMNVIEQNLQTINARGYNQNIGAANTYYAGKATPTYKDYNRIESACLMIYTKYTANIANLQRLSFTLGNQKGMRC